MHRIIVVAAGMGHVVLYGELPRFWWLLALFFSVGWLAIEYYRRGCSVLGKQPFSTLKLLSAATQLLVLFSLAAGFGSWRLETLVAAQLPHSLDKTKNSLTVEVEQLQLATSLRAQFSAVVIDHPSASKGAAQSLVGKRLRLAWYSPPELTVGEQWQVEVILRRPRGMINPGGFDYGVWLLGQGYQATGYVTTKSNATLVGAMPPSLLQRFRLHLRGAMQEISAEPAHRFFAALLMGDRQALTVDDWHVLQATGTVHLMAISGLHVGLVAALGFTLAALGVRALLGIAWLRSANAYRLLPPLLAIALSSGYALLAGFSVPTQRALIAVVLVNALWAIGIRCSRWALLVLALLLVSAGETLAWLQSGFWLSFVAVAFLLAKYDGMAGRQIAGSRYQRFQHGLFSAVKVQCLLSVGLCVPLWLLGFPASLLSPLANVLAVPLVALFFVPALLLWVPLSFTPLSEIALIPLAWAFNFLWSGLTALASWPYALFWPAAKLQGFGLGVAVLACVMVLLPASFGMRLGACVLVVLLALGTRTDSRPFELVALDVGQGLAVAIHQPQGTLLYDTGAVFSERFNAGSHIIAPYLRWRGAGPLSVMVSHADADHRGGAAAIFNQFEPEKIWFGEPFTALPMTAQACTAGQKWLQGGAIFSVLWPQAGQRSNNSAVAGLGAISSNNRSCVLLVEYQSKRFLLPGDIDSSVEKWLVEYGAVGHVDVLVAPHHGSKTSSSQDFLAALSPSHIIVSAGYKNRYGHPHSEVLERYQALGAKVWNTGELGAIRVTVEEGNLVINAERLSRPKVWH